MHHLKTTFPNPPGIKLLPPTLVISSTPGTSESSEFSLKTEESGSPSASKKNSTGALSVDPRWPLSSRRRLRSTSCWRNLSMQSSMRVDVAFLCPTVTCNCFKSRGIHSVALLNDNTPTVWDTCTDFYLATVKNFKLLRVVEGLVCFLFELGIFL